LQQRGSLLRLPDMVIETGIHAGVCSPCDLMKDEGKTWVQRRLDAV
jgi:hypothetical protein